jgi:hypothetical protein
VVYASYPLKIISRIAGTKTKVFFDTAISVSMVKRVDLSAKISVLLIWDNSACTFGAASSALSKFRNQSIHEFFVRLPVLVGIITIGARPGRIQSNDNASLGCNANGLAVNSRTADIALVVPLAPPK